VVVGGGGDVTEILGRTYIVVPELDLGMSDRESENV